MIKRPESAGKIITCQSRSLTVVTCSWNWQTKIDWHLFMFLKELYCQRNHKPGKSLWPFKPINHSPGPWKCTGRNLGVSAIQPDKGKDLSHLLQMWPKRKVDKKEPSTGGIGAREDGGQGSVFQRVAGDARWADQRTYRPLQHGDYSVQTLQALNATGTDCCVFPFCHFPNGSLYCGDLVPTPSWRR